MLVGQRKAFRLLRDNAETVDAAVAGVVAYEPSVDTFNMAALDSRITRAPRLALSLREDGGYPIFTAPVADLVPLPWGP